MNSLRWIFALMLLASCSMLHRRADHVPQPNEIADHPAMLYDGSVPPNEMTLHGVKLGDPESAVIRSPIDHRNKDWIVCHDQARYRIENGVVATLGVWDTKILQPLNINSPQDIEARFGKPDSIDTAQPLLIYRYNGGHVSVLWNTQENQINAVNISK